MLWVFRPPLFTHRVEQVRIAQQRLAEQVDVAERRAYEVRATWMGDATIYLLGGDYRLYGCFQK